jgi:hypothetical protein
MSVVSAMMNLFLKEAGELLARRLLTGRAKDIIFVKSAHLPIKMRIS